LAALTPDSPNWAFQKLSIMSWEDKAVVVGEGADAAAMVAVLDSDRKKVVLKNSLGNRVSFLLTKLIKTKEAGAVSKKTRVKLEFELLNSI
jgi:hypothetical protein